MTLETAHRHFRQGDFASAQKILRRLVKAGQNMPAALRLLGYIEGQRQDYAAAIEFFISSLRYDASSVETWYYLGVAHQKMQAHGAAVDAFREAVKRAPDFFEGTHNLGLALLATGRLDEAAQALGQAARLNPASFEAHLNHGVVLGRQRLHEAEIASYEKALAINRHDPVLLENYGAALCQTGRFPEAVVHYRAVRAEHPEFAFVRGGLLFAQANAADWSGFEQELDTLHHDIAQGKDCISPFDLVVLSGSAEDQLRAICSYSEKYYPAAEAPLQQERAPSADGRLRIAYLSADFSTHATAFLMARTFELHDRSRFEVTAISTGRNDNSPMRQRLAQAFERFVDASGRSDEEIAQQIAELQVDVLVDLKGYTTDARPGVLAQRTAPVQIGYLGFPGTMGSRFIDYLVADAFLIPETHRACYAEKIIYLPDSYQPNDATREIAGAPTRRADAGLRDDQFVYCNFNSSYKIMPAFFDIWMRLLARTADSVLWLLGGPDAYQHNLRREAEQRGIAAERLVFAPPVDHPTHLRRLQLADLSLDNLPCNAHTTASDALWAGLPLLTCAGSTFAGRVAGSLLTAVGLPELVTHSTAAYEQLALDLAQDRPRLEGLRRRLAAARSESPLFDSQSHTRHLEAAYLAAWARHEAGAAPDHIVMARA